MGNQVWAVEVFTNNLPVDVKKKLLMDYLPATPVFGRKRKGFEELFVLQTPSQFVVLGVGPSPDPLLNFFIQDPDLFKNAHFYKSTEASLNLLFATATGLCSNVKGGAQILSDIQRAHYAALHCGGVGLTLDTIIRQSIRVGKKIRKETDLDNLSSSVFESAMDLVLSKVAVAREASILVIGHGEVTRSALEFLTREGMQNVVVAVSTAEQREKIARDFGVVTIEAEEINPFFNMADLVINEDSSDPIIKNDLLKYSGSTHKKVMLDFGIASDLHQHLRSLPLMTLLTIDDINNSPVGSTDLFNAIENAWKLVDQEVKSFVPRLAEMASVPVLHSCWSEIVQRGEQDISFLNRGVPHIGLSPLRMINNYNNALLKGKSKIVFNPEWGLNAHTREAKPSNAARENLIGISGKHLN